MKNLTLALLSVVAVGAASVTSAACSSSSDTPAGTADGGFDSGADCALPSSITYDCNPVSASDIVDGGLADGAALCPPPPNQGDAGDALYPLGCGATLPQHGAFTDARTGCNGPITCTCQYSGSAPGFVCPD